MHSKIHSGDLKTNNNHPRSGVKPKTTLKMMVRSGVKSMTTMSPLDNRNMLNECKRILCKLIRHKHGWIFNSLVDASALGIVDYHQIVRRPMDLRTVKLILSQNLYPSPAEFAADVRLTFNNAMLYNPKTHQVHVMAEELLARFEDLFRPIQQKIDRRNVQIRERQFRALSIAR